jgi:ferric-dicitrate binding protein FerR (iron transport regulator)
VLEEGKVEFTLQEHSCVAELKPNERLMYNNDSVRITITEPSKYSAWVEGKLMFRGDPMPEVARRIARWYNVEVELVDKDLDKDVIRGTFQDDSLEDVLYYISLTSPIRFRIIERKILDNGTYQKKKVLLYRKNI